MKTPLVFFALSLAVILLISCQDTATVQVIPVPANTALIGTWIYTYDSDTLMILAKSRSLKADEYGFTLKANGEFIERKINGRCGTPPVVYAEYTGNWQYQTDHLLKISVPYWGGTEFYQLAIVSLTGDTIKVHRHNISRIR